MGLQQKKKEAIRFPNDDFGRLSRFPIFFFRVSIFWKLIGFIVPGMVPWLSKNPRTNLEARGPIWMYLVMKWVSKVSKKHENRLPPCHVRPKPGQSSRESHRMVHAMPPDTPRPPNYHLKLLKNKFLWKNRFSVVPHFLNFVCQYRISFLLYFGGVILEK